MRDRRMTSQCVLATALAVMALPAMAAAQTAPVAHPLEASSLYRASDEWRVKTIFKLTAEDHDPNPDNSGKWTFTILNPAQFASGELSRLRCATSSNFPDDAGAKAGPIEVSAVAGLEIFCEYQPPVGEDGDEEFQYQVTDAGGLKSAPATVTIDIKPQGVRWQFQTAAGQFVTSNAGGNALDVLPDIFGKTTQDFMFNLDWVFRHPQKLFAEPKLGATADGHIQVRTGYLSKAEAVTAEPVTEADGGTPAAEGEGEEALAPRRKLTFGLEGNYNFVLSSTGTGTFVEIGLLGRGNLDVDAEDDQSLRETADRIVRLVRKNKGAATFHGELGGRVAVKYPRREAFRTSVQHVKCPAPDKTEAATGRARRDPQTCEAGAELFTRNADDLVTLEFGVSKDGALGDLATVTEKRYFVRAMLTLIAIPGAPGTSKPLIGFELTGWGDQPKQVKVLYGADITAIGSVFGLGK